MSIATLPSRKEILRDILSDIARRDEVNAEAWDKALERGLAANSELSLEELVGSAYEIGEHMAGFLDGYIEASK
jgi:hypothetical protein